MKKNRFRPGSSEYMETMLRSEKILTAFWYQRMSGAVEWKPGERETVNAAMDKVAMEIDHLIGKQELRETNLLRPLLRVRWLV